MPTLEHPDMPGQKITVADIALPFHLARGWVEVEPDPVLTAADIEAAEVAKAAAAQVVAEPEPEPGTRTGRKAKTG